MFFIKTYIKKVKKCINTYKIKYTFIYMYCNNDQFKLVNLYMQEKYNKKKVVYNIILSPI